MNWHIDSAADTAKRLDTDPVHGLSSEKAQRRLERYGKNILTPRRTKTLGQCFRGQAGSFLPVVLFCNAIIAAVVAVNSVSGGWLEPVITALMGLLFCLACAVIEYISLGDQEKLRCAAVRRVSVMRDGKLAEISAEQLVPGDIILLGEGELVPADCRLIESHELFCDEHIITGSSSPVKKNAGAEPDVTTPIKERANILYAGCVVLSGKCAAIITETGAETEAGRRAALLSDDNLFATDTGRQLNAMSKSFAAAGLIAALVIFIIAFSFRHPHGLKAIDIFLTCVSLALVTIPDLLPLLLQAILARGALDMTKDRVTVSRPHALERLECISVLFTGKEEATERTDMSVAQVWTPEDKLRHIPEDIKRPSVKKLLELAAVCGKLRENEVIRGALSACRSKSVSLDEKYPAVMDFRAFRYGGLTTSIRRVNGKLLIIVKGAADAVLARCDGIDIDRMQTVCSLISSSALHVTAVACKELSDSDFSKLTRSSAESELSFVGFIGITNPPCAGAQQSMELCRSAGIRCVMLTGDSAATADAVAREAGILSSGDDTITGLQIAAMSDTELENNLRKYSVISGITPEQKLRVLSLWQQSAEYVAVNGSYVSDIAMLRCADAAIAIGRATGAAESVSDISIEDGTLTGAVRSIIHARGICAGARRAVRFYLANCAGVILAVVGALAISQIVGLNAYQLLMLQLIGGLLPAFALGLTLDEGAVAHVPPHKKHSPLFSVKMIRSIVLQALMLGGLGAAAFAVGLRTGEAHAGLMMFGTSALARILLAVSSRSDKSLFASDILRCRKLLISCSAAAALTVLAILLSPVKLSAAQWLVMSALSLGAIVLHETAKLIYMLIEKYLNTSQAE